MNPAVLNFPRPDHLQASAPPESRGLARDDVRLLVSTGGRHIQTSFRDLPTWLNHKDLLVVNRSATINASFEATGQLGKFIVNRSTDYGHGLWLVEPRWSTAQPGPLPFHTGDDVWVAGRPGRMVAAYPGIPRLWFLLLEGDPASLPACCGNPIRYGYVEDLYPLDYYQTIFSRDPGSAEMPSAARPFTRRLIEELEQKGVDLAEVVLHTGVSSLEIENDRIELQPLYPEPFEVPPETAQAVNQARQRSSRVIAVGTTVVRALESAWDGRKVHAVKGFTRLFVHPSRGVRVVNGLITGFHDPMTTHLALLTAIAGENTVRSAYAQAIDGGFLWHEFGDSHLILN